MTKKISLVAALAGIALAMLSPPPAAWSEEFYHPPYAYSPAYQYGYAPYNCCELSTIYPAHGRPLSSALPVRYRYVDYRNSHRWGFYGEAGRYVSYR